jgi:hypothetical protein
VRERGEKLYATSDKGTEQREVGNRHGHRKDVGRTNGKEMK